MVVSMFVKCLLRKWGNSSNLANMFPFWLKPPSRLPSHRFFWTFCPQWVSMNQLYSLYIITCMIVVLLIILSSSWWNAMEAWVICKGMSIWRNKIKATQGFWFWTDLILFQQFSCRCQCCFSTCNLYILMKRSCNCGTTIQSAIY